MTSPVSNQNAVRPAFIEYLKRSFMHLDDFKHPITKNVYSAAEVKAALSKIKTYCPENYKALYCLWTTGGNRNFIAERLFVSASTVKRMWDEGIDLTMLLLIFPDLEPEEFSFYTSYA